MKNNRGHFIHQQNIVNERHIEIIDNHPPLIRMINMKINQLIIVVPFQVKYQQDPKSMYPNSQNIQHISIIYNTNLVLIVLLVSRTGRGTMKTIIHNTITKKWYKYKILDNSTHQKPQNKIAPNKPNE